VATTLQLTGFAPNEVIAVASPTLQRACGSTELFQRFTGFGPLPQNYKTDGAGNLNLVLTAQGCNSGMYPISATETTGAHRELDASFSVEG
jgi:hypothetical protein